MVKIGSFLTPPPAGAMENAKCSMLTATPGFDLSPKVSLAWCPFRAPARVTDVTVITDVTDVTVTSPTHDKEKQGHSPRLD